MSDYEEVDVLDILNSHLQTERVLFSSLRFLEGGTRNHVLAAHMRNSSALLGILRTYQLQPATRMVINIPMDLSGNWMDPVPVVPTREQIAAATEQHVGVDTTCSICQDSLTCATRIRACGHCFHGQCIQQWLSVNSRCPMCRHDLRTPVATTTNAQDSSVHADS
jgi:hypothetical protein